MFTMETKSKKSPEEIIKQAVKFFGPEGYQLEIKEQTDSWAVFEGGGGGIEVTACPEGKETSVELSSKEWDHQVKEFIGKLN